VAGAASPGVPASAGEPPGRGAAVVEVASDGGGEGAPWAGRLGPWQAVVLRPAD